eukprot:TRINITY_DN32711_c1_g2_i6.p1 TRINITY_DN32711_c1_g2~~TRINITY_DN32711_c1_g2_i6.p1  ORF type:complete len:283 (-),score=27.31 TRINITY_DN32711_c1_g2_i6:161-1009(-)
MASATQHVDLQHDPSAMMTDKRIIGIMVAVAIGFGIAPPPTCKSTAFVTAFRVATFCFAASVSCAYAATKQRYKIVSMHVALFFNESAWLCLSGMWCLGFVGWMVIGISELCFILAFCSLMQCGFRLLSMPAIHVSYALVGGLLCYSMQPGRASPIDAMDDSMWPALASLAVAALVGIMMYYIAKEVYPDLLRTMRSLGSAALRRDYVGTPVRPIGVDIVPSPLGKAVEHIPAESSLVVGWDSLPHLEQDRLDEAKAGKSSVQAYGMKLPRKKDEMEASDAI